MVDAALRVHTVCCGQDKCSWHWQVWICRYLHAFELSTLYWEILVYSSQDCGNTEQPVLQEHVVTFALQLWIFSFVPFSRYFSFFIAYERISIQQKKSKIQPASLSSGNTSSSLLWKSFLDWNCCFLQTCLAPDFSSLVSVSPRLEWQAPAVYQCWVTAAGGIYVGKPFTIKRCVSKVCFFKLHFYVKRVYNYQFII